MTAIKNYDARLDSKNRITIRGSVYKNYNVKVFDNGCIILEPRILAVPDTVSTKTLTDMEKAVENFKLGVVSPTIDLSDFQ